HPLRQAAHRALEHGGLQLELGQHRLRTRGVVAFAEAARQELDELAAAQVVRGREALRDVGKAAARLRLAAGQAEDADGSGFVGAQVEQALDECGLAGAVRADQSERFPRGDREVDGFQGGELAVALAQRVDAHRRVHKSFSHGAVILRPVQQGPMVQIQNVAFGYDAARPVLRDVSLSSARGSVVGIMGQSGCGKTTLLRIIAAQSLPVSGTARVLGEATSELDRDALYRMRRRMGMLFQFGALFTDMSVYENVAFPLREHTALPEDLIHDLVMLKLEAVGLRGAAQLMPAELSGGMARRVALARSIALDPQLILYDEPFTGLDPISFGVIVRLIRELNDSLGATSIIVTHDVQEALGVVDYVYFMADGRVIAEGKPDEIRASREPFVRQFVNGELDGPVPFHYPAPGYAAELELAGD